MKSSGLFKLIVLVNIFANTFAFSQPAKANIFEEASVDQSKIIAVAAPYRHGYNLVVIEQIEGKQSWWSEQGSRPVKVEPLLMNFDFAGHCRRATDTNGYSIRVNNKEYASDYLLNIVDVGSELHLVASHRNPNEPKLVIGKTQGKTEGLTKFFLSPGWNFTKRSYQGQLISHFYFSKGGTNAISSNRLETEKQNYFSKETATSTDSTPVKSQPNTGGVSITIINQNQQDQVIENNQSIQQESYLLF